MALVVVVAFAVDSVVVILAVHLAQNKQIREREYKLAYSNEFPRVLFINFASPLVSLLAEIFKCAPCFYGRAICEASTSSCLCMSSFEIDLATQQMGGDPFLFPLLSSLFSLPASLQKRLQVLAFIIKRKYDKLSFAVRLIY